MRPEVLVVDDEEDIRQVLSLVLELRGFCVTTAADGAEALERIRRPPAPDVILLDLRMPRVTGEQFLQAMRSDPALGHVPVIILSGDGSARQIAMALGVPLFLAKPVDLDDLMAVLAEATHERRSVR